MYNIYIICTYIHVSAFLYMKKAKIHKNDKVKTFK